jgi:branched-chain amino acid transport system permease protein
MGNISGVVIGGMIILLFDRVILAQSTQLVRSLGQLLSVPELQKVDLQLWRWFFFGATLMIVMLLRPEGLFPSSRRAAELHADVEEAGGQDVAPGSPQA